MSLEVENGQRALAGNESSDNARKPFEDALLAAAARGLGMDPNAENELQKPDVDFLKQLLKLPVDMSNMPSGTDVLGMRRWIKSALLSDALIEHRAKVQLKLRRPKTPVKKEIITVNSSDGDGTYDLWIYEATPDGSHDATLQRPAILMMHGGGWIHGSPLGDEDLATLFSSELDAVVVGIDYRLAPEHPYPAPLADCTDALEWVVQNSTQYRIDVDRIALWGASAGGNMAAAVALHATERKEKKTGHGLCLVSLVVPVMAHPQAEALYDRQRLTPLSPNESLFASSPKPPKPLVLEFEKLFDLYTGGNMSVTDPLLSPLMAQPQSIQGHPKTIVTVAACDALRAQGLAYGDLLRASGAQVTEDLLPGAPHMFTLPTHAELTKRWTERQVGAFAAAFGITYS